MTDDIVCPHCHGSAEIVGEYTYRVICRSCRIRTLHYASPDIARAVWEGKSCNEFLYRARRP